MTRGTFGSHSFIPFIASQFITDFGCFGQHGLDPTPVLAKAGSLSGGSSSPSSARHAVQYSWYNRGEVDWTRYSMFSLKYVSPRVSMYALRDTQSSS